MIVWVVSLDCAEYGVGLLWDVRYTIDMGI